MYRQVPNALTILRLVLAAAFFVALNQYRFSLGGDGYVVTAIGLFILAAVSDYFDGYLARKWQVETAFGRIMDPFCDKVLVLGAFIYLSGPRFVIPDEVRHNAIFTMASGVYPWMVALMLARELLVTGIRDEMESHGVKFGAKLTGKLKTVLQLVAVPVILVIVLYNPRAPGHHWTHVVRDLLVYTTVLATVASGWPYVRSTVRSLSGMRKEAGAPTAGDR